MAGIRPKKKKTTIGDRFFEKPPHAARAREPDDLRCARAEACRADVGNGIVELQPRKKRKPGCKRPCVASQMKLRCAAECESTDPDLHWLPLARDFCACGNCVLSVSKPCARDCMEPFASN